MSANPEAAPVAERNAYRFPREVRPGCTHQLACRCAQSYWVREPSAAELEMEKKIREAR